MNIASEEVYFVDYLKDSAKKIIYAPLRSYLGLMSKENMDKFLDNPASDVRTKLLAKVKSFPSIDPKKILSDLEHVAPDLSIPITDNCNLRCHYCHASAGELHKTESMDEAMIEAVLECYFTRLESKEVKGVKITFQGGGEPTFRFDKLTYAIARVREIAAQRDITCSFYMATNGCYGSKIREFVTKNFKEVSLSFDGPAHIQNLHRPLANGKPSFDLVYETARYFARVKFPFALRATVSDYSIRYLTEIVDFFDSNFPGINLGLEPLVPVGRALRGSPINPPDAKMFADELIRIMKYTEQKTISIANSASSEYDIVRPVFCSSIGIPNWTVLMNGDIACCSRDGAPEEFTFGRLDYRRRTVAIDEVKLNNIRHMNVLSYAECKDCFAKYQCAGDCPDRRMSCKPDCDSLRKIGTFILNKRIDA